MNPKAEDDLDPGPVDPIGICRALIEPDYDLSKIEGAVRRSCIAAIRELVAEASSMTGWRPDQVLERLGCRITTDEELADAKLLGLNRSERFLRFLTSDLMAQLDDELDRRRALLMLKRMYDRIGNEAGSGSIRVERLVQAFHDDSCGLPAQEYVWLGELDSAEILAAEIVDSATPGERARAAVIGLDVDHGAHISLPRLEALRVVADARSTLGAQVAVRVADHVLTCPRCEAQFEALGGRSSALIELSTPSTTHR